MSVLWQQVAGSDEVEAPLTDLPTQPRPGWLRRWLWAPAVVVAAALYVVLGYGPEPSASGEMWMMLGMMAAGLVTAVSALVRYRDDQRRAADAKASDALRTTGRSVTGALEVTGERPVAGGRMLRGIVTYPTDDGAAEQYWTLLVPTIEASDEPDSPRPDDAPRDGDPAAVWWAPGTDVVVVRYARSWADEVHQRARRRR